MGIGTDESVREARKAAKKKRSRGRRKRGPRDVGGATLHQLMIWKENGDWRGERKTEGRDRAAGKIHEDGPGR